MLFRSLRSMAEREQAVARTPDGALDLTHLRALHADLLPAVIEAWLLEAGVRYSLTQREREHVAQRHGDRNSDGSSYQLCNPTCEYAVAQYQCVKHCGAAYAKRPSTW